MAASERILPGSLRLRRLLPLGVALLVMAAASTVQYAIELAIAAPLAVRGLAVVLFTSPIGFVLGFFFPMGLKRLRSESPLVQSWMWGLNGALGVLGSLAAIVIAMTYGIQACLFAGAATYLLLTLPAQQLFSEKPALSSSANAATQDSKTQRRKRRRAA